MTYCTGLGAVNPVVADGARRDGNYRVPRAIDLVVAALELLDCLGKRRLFGPVRPEHNRSEFVNGRQEIIAFLTRKWTKELDYRFDQRTLGL